MIVQKIVGEVRDVNVGRVRVEERLHRLGVHQLAAREVEDLAAGRNGHEEVAPDDAVRAALGGRLVDVRDVEGDVVRLAEDRLHGVHEHGGAGELERGLDGHHGVVAADLRTYTRVNKGHAHTYV